MRLIFKSYCIRQFVLTFVIFFVVHAVADSDVKSKVALCSACHGETGVSFNQEWPNLAGQHVSYLIKQLQDYQQHARKDAVMNNLVASLSAQDMQDIAEYYSLQKTAVDNVKDINVRGQA